MLNQNNKKDTNSKPEVLHKPLNHYSDHAKQQYSGVRQPSKITQNIFENKQNTYNNNLDLFNREPNRGSGMQEGHGIKNISHRSKQSNDDEKGMHMDSRSNARKGSNMSKRAPSSGKAPKNGLAVISDNFSSIKSKGFSFGRRSTDTELKNKREAEEKIIAGTLNTRNTNVSINDRSQITHTGIDLQYAADLYNLRKKKNDLNKMEVSKTIEEPSETQESGKGSIFNNMFSFRSKKSVDLNKRESEKLRIEKLSARNNSNVDFNTSSKVKKEKELELMTHQNTPSYNLFPFHSFLRKQSSPVEDVSKKFAIDHRKKVDTMSSARNKESHVTQIADVSSMLNSMSNKNQKITKAQGVKNSFDSIFRRKKMVPHQVEKSIEIVQNPTYYMKSLEYYFKIDRQDYFAKLYKEHFQHTLSSIKFINSLDPGRLAENEPKKLELKKKVFYKGKKTIIFDLDETLVHCDDSDLGDYKVPISLPSGETVNASIFIRPYAKEVLEKQCKDFEIIQFTASHKCYANSVMDLLDPTKKIVSHRLFRENCYQTPQGVHIKDQRIFNRDFKRQIQVDNAAYSYGLQIDNGVPIIPFYNNREDAELLFLAEYLNQLKNVDDIRVLNKAHFKTHLFSAGNTLDECYKMLFRK